MPQFTYAIALRGLGVLNPGLKAMAMGYWYSIDFSLNLF